MAITIQELLASDTISQVVDKINFNFDQLLLNGGGPIGPAGPLGPPGPIGGRGERGSQWYEGTEDPNVTPPTQTPLIADYYLQSNGDVWEYTGLTWTNTGINLIGPIGPAGAGGGWSKFGNKPYPIYATTSQNVLYPTPIVGTGITSNNEGVPTALIGAVGPDDTSSEPTIPFTPAFQLNEEMAGSIDASIVSMLVHQKNSSATAIKFMGGENLPNDNYEQDDIGNLSSIGLGTDDSIVINVPKPVTGTPTNIQDTYGFNLYTLQKGQNFRAGRSISFTTGTLGNSLSGDNDISDFTIQLNTVNESKLPKYEMNILGDRDATISAGNITLPNNTEKEGNIVLDSGRVNLIAKDQITIRSVSLNWALPGLETVTDTPIGLVGITQAGKLTTLSVASGGSFENGILGWDGTQLTSDTGEDNRLVRWDDTTRIQSSGWELDDDDTLYPVNSAGSLGSETEGTVAGIVMGTDKRILFSDSLGFIDRDGNTSITGSQARFIKRGLNSLAQLQLGLKYINPTPIGDTSNVLNTQLYFGDSFYQFLDDNLKPLSRSFPKIEFGGNNDEVNATDANENALNTNPPGVYMKGGLPGINTWESNILKIKGSDGRDNGEINESYGRRRGKGVQISGGDGINGFQGGSVLISPGGTTDTSSTDGQYIWLGYNPHYKINGVPDINSDIRRSASHIAIGPTQASVDSNSWGNPSLNYNKGFVFIQQPPAEKYDGNFENDYVDEYVLRIQNNRTETGFTGGVMIGSKDNKHALNIYPNLSEGSYWSRTERGDTGIFLRNNGDSGDGEGGLSIAVKDQNNLGIRLDPGPGPDNTEQIFFYGKTFLDDNKIDSFDEAAFQFNGLQSIMDANQVKTVSRDETIFASGTMYPKSTEGNLAGTGENAGYLMWQRIGRIVHVTGVVNFGDEEDIRSIRLPVIGETGSKATKILGTGTALIGTNLDETASISIIESAPWDFTAKIGDDFYEVPMGRIWVSFSYILE